MRPFCARTADGAGALRRAGDEPGRYRLRDRELALHHWRNAPRVPQAHKRLSQSLDGGRLGDAILVGRPGGGAVHPVIGSGGSGNTEG
jgi:hypothetical protein